MLWPWNAARAASKRPLPKPRKVHAPVDPFAQNPTMLRPGTGRMLRNQDGAPAHYPGDALTRDYDTCRECGLHICGCEQRFEMQQEAQRAQLARSVDARHSMRPGVQHHLRYGDPRRRSLGYNERDYDESRRVLIAIMKAEYARDYPPPLFGVDDRALELKAAIAEHERKLPRQKLALEKVYENNETLFGINVSPPLWAPLAEVQPKPLTREMVVEYLSKHGGY